MSVRNVLLTLQYLAGMLQGVWFEVSLRIGWLPLPYIFALLCSSVVFGTGRGKG